MDKVRPVSNLTEIEGTIHVFECTLSSYPGHVGEDMWSGYEARVHVHVSNPLLAVLQVMENWLSSWKNGQV